MATRPTIKSVLEALLEYKKQNPFIPEMQTNAAAWSSIVEGIPMFAPIPADEALPKPDNPRYVGRLFGMRVFIDPGLPKGTFQIRAYACEYCGTIKDDSRKTCLKCGAPY